MNSIDLFVGLGMILRLRDIYRCRGKENQQKEIKRNRNPPVVFPTLLCYSCDKLDEDIRKRASKSKRRLSRLLARIEAPAKLSKLSEVETESTDPDSIGGTF